jgi:putative ABC transport system permease protein
MTDIHLRSDLGVELEPNSDIAYVYLFSAIALFLLVIASINFMNLSTARSANRAREVGVRKVLGSGKKQLIYQFLVESSLMSIAAVVLAVFMAQLALPYFNDLTGKALSLPLASPLFICILLGGAIMIGILAGLYPAFFLSSFPPISVLKGPFVRGFSSGWIRNALVVFQFAISILLIAGTFVIYQQLNYIQNKKLGFDKDNILVLKNTYILENKIQAFKQEITRIPEVVSASVSGYMPVPSSRSNTVYWPKGEPTDENMVLMQTWSVDHDYIKTLGMNMVDGRDFSREFLTDSSAFILNEAAVRQFGYENPVEEIIQTYASNDMQEVASYKVIGVVEDFHFESMRDNITPLCMYIGGSDSRVAVRFNTNDIAGFLTKVENTWNDMAPGQPFEYEFLDESFDSIYKAERRVGTIFIIFAMLAIFIASLGLFALSTFSAEKRVKEIGIRKIVGASVAQIFTLLSTEFFKWILISYIIAVPLAIYGARQWLQNFTFQAKLGIGVFIATAVLIVLIALITISFQVVRAAVADPVRSLRYE